MLTYLQGLDGSMALTLDGSDDYVPLPAFTFGGEMTICSHIKFDAFNAFSRLIDASANEAGTQGGGNANILIANLLQTPELECTDL